MADEYPGWNAPLVFYRKVHDEAGATYTADGLLFMDFIDNVMPSLAGNKPEIWLCNVTHDVFGEHPERVFVLKVEK